MVIFHCYVSLPEGNPLIQWDEAPSIGASQTWQVGDEVTKDEPLTTNPNVGGFGQAGGVGGIWWYQL